ncbi:MAG: hypothetical protein JWO41_238 [Candidatus Saccharibacteria bacterium]|nr:hypothetical protein [Candidatus Saccharibacteria bacterium]
MGVEVASLRLDEDPELLALIAAEEAEQAARAQLLGDQPTEARKYNIGGELYDEESLRAVCSYFSKMGDLAFKAVISSYEVHGQIELPAHHQEPKPKAEPKAEPEVVHEVEPPQPAAEAPVLTFEQEIFKRELAQEQAELVVSPEALVPAVAIKQTAEAITEAIEGAKDQPLQVISLVAAPERPQTPSVPEVPGVPEPVANEVADEVAITEPTAPLAEVTKINPEIITTPAMIDRELLAQVEPELFQDLEAIIEHVGEDIVENQPESVFPEETQQAIEDYIAVSTPEEAVVVETLNMLISLASERLTDLIQSDQTESIESIEIQKLIMNWYQGLAERGLTPENLTAEAFVELIMSRSLKAAELPLPLDTEEEIEEPHEKGTLEKGASQNQLGWQFSSYGPDSTPYRLPLGWLRSQVA